MKYKSIWYCTGCFQKCAVKITNSMSMFKCILFNDETARDLDCEPSWHKHEPDKAKRELKKDLEDA